MSQNCDVSTSQQQSSSLNKTTRPETEFTLENPPMFWVSELITQIPENLNDVGKISEVLVIAALGRSEHQKYQEMSPEYK